MLSDLRKVQSQWFKVIEVHFLFLPHAHHWLMGAVLIALTRGPRLREQPLSHAASASADKASSQAHASSETFRLEVTHFTAQHQSHGHISHRGWRYVVLPPHVGEERVGTCEQP